MSKTLEVDIILFGGGALGLWLLNCLHQAGYRALLLESEALGQGQSLHAQGIIHGGLKYALSGFLNTASNTIQAMPERWEACLRGEGEIDLSKVVTLSQEQLLWSTGKIASSLACFFASKTLKSRVQPLNKKDFPAILQHPEFKGQVFRLNERVLDTESLIETLAKPYYPFIFKVDPDKLEFLVSNENPPRVTGICIQTSEGQEDKTVTLSAQYFLLTAGEGNEQLLQKLQKLKANLTKPAESSSPDSIEMQRRPLQMVAVQSSICQPFFAHCIDTNINPRITITTPRYAAGEAPTWYLGGQLAEEGANRTPEEQLLKAKTELSQLFPWFSFEDGRWTSFFINRAEPKQPFLKRPDSFYFKTLNTFNNVLVAWPIKLTMIPLLSEAILDSLKKLITPLKSKSNHAASSLESKDNDFLEFIPLEKPPFAKPRWKKVEG